MAILPTLSHQNLQAEMNGKKYRRIGYETSAVRIENDSILLIHHGSEIACLLPNGDVELVYSGYDSPTTASRIDKALVDNGTGCHYSYRPSKGASFVINESGEMIKHNSDNSTIVLKPKN